MARLFRRDRGRAGATEPTPTAEEILRDLRDPLPSGPLEWGVPTLCPRCDGWGYIDRLDLVDRVMRLHCPSCHFHWEVSEAQIDAAKALAESASEQQAQSVDA